MPTASCSCGALTATVAEGLQPAVVACHCLACQRRTGAPFGVLAYYPTESVAVAGESRTWSRPTDEGNVVTTRFCPTCGVTVLFNAGKHPALTGIAVGAFADPGFPPPLRAVWEETRHGWVETPTALQHFPRGRT